MLDQLRGGKLQFPISYFALCEKPSFIIIIIIIIIILRFW